MSIEAWTMHIVIAALEALPPSAVAIRPRQSSRQYDLWESDGWTNSTHVSRLLTLTKSLDNGVFHLQSGRLRPILVC